MVVVQFMVVIIEGLERATDVGLDTLPTWVLAVALDFAPPTVQARECRSPAPKRRSLFVAHRIGVDGVDNFERRVGAGRRVPYSSAFRPLCPALGRKPFVGCCEEPADWSRQSLHIGDV